MTAALRAILALIEQVLPLIGQQSGLAGTIINTLTKWVPVIIAEGEALYEPLKNIITALQSSGDITATQKAELEALNTRVDAAFEASAAGLDPDAA